MLSIVMSSIKKAAAAAIQTITRSPRKENTVTMRSDRTSDNVPSDWAKIAAEDDEKARVSRQPSAQSFMTTVSESKSAGSQTSDPSPCGRCRKLVKAGDIAIECEICQQWFHAKCEEVSKPQYKMLLESSQSKDGKKKAKLHWFCSTCECTSVNFMRGLSFHQGKIEALEKRVESVEADIQTKASKEQVQQLEERVKKIETKQEDPIAGTSGVTTSDIESKLKEHASEQKERERRTNNIVVFNMPEPPDSITPAERMNRDNEHFLKVTKEVCKVDIKKGEIKKSFRLGKRASDKTRPLIIKLKDIEKKKKLFLSLKYLRDHKGRYEDVRIAHDLTKTQRAEQKQMIDKAKEMDKELGQESENFIHLVRGSPDNLRIVKVKRNM